MGDEGIHGRLQRAGIVEAQIIVGKVANVDLDAAGDAGRGGIGAVGVGSE